jgi:hypothetical protein
MTLPIQNRKSKIQNRQTLPPLPPRLNSATLAAADHLARLAAAENIPLAGERGQALPHLVTILYLIRERCAAVQGQARPEPSGGQTITVEEIAAVLETIGRIMVSEGWPELAGRNASWFGDAAGVVEMMEQELDKE